MALHDVIKRTADLVSVAELTTRCLPDELLGVQTLTVMESVCLDFLEILS